jgi:hypothetical protein
MGISTESIIHYTNEFEYLTSIIKEGFRIKYCAEEIKLADGASRSAHPMLSFCDIPLSTSKDHFGKYGYYGIGLTKSWAKDVGINPVIYIDKESLIAETLLSFIKERRRKTDSNLTKDQRNDILRIRSYMKNYSGDLKRNGKEIIKNYKFFDEREWRLIPEKSQINNEKFSIQLKDYNKDRKFYNQKLEGCRIKFKLSDISYIIVKTEEDVKKMITFLTSTFKNEFEKDELSYLFTKICTTKQINEDY